MEVFSESGFRAVRVAGVRHLEVRHGGIVSMGSRALQEHRRPSRRQPFSSGRSLRAPISMIPGSSTSSSPTTYFQKSPLPANTVIRFVPQQTAWIVERMGKFNRILEPGLAILIPVLDRIAYVQSLKESAQEIPSQKAITADNVTLELDGVLYTRVFDPYKAR